MSELGGLGGFVVDRLAEHLRDEVETEEDRPLHGPGSYIRVPALLHAELVRLAASVATENRIAGRHPERTARLAVVWAGHPEWDPRWAPESLRSAS